MVEKEIDCLLVGDPDADKLGGDPGGVNRGVLVCDTKNMPGEMWALLDADKRNPNVKFQFYPK